MWARLRLRCAVWPHRHVLHVGSHAADLRDPGPALLVLTLDALHLSEEDRGKEGTLEEPHQEAGDAGVPGGGEIEPPGRGGSSCRGRRRTRPLRPREQLWPGASAAMAACYVPWQRVLLEHGLVERFDIEPFSDFSQMSKLHRARSLLYRR